MTGVEIIAAAVVAAVVLGMFVTSMAFALVVYPRWQNRQWQRVFPEPVPGWKARMSSPPPFAASADDVRALFDLMWHRVIEAKGYDAARARAVLNLALVYWVPADPALEIQDPKLVRHVRDAWGRNIAGDTTDRVIRVVYRRDDRLGNTALAHELGHMLHRLERLMDLSHGDEVMWKRIVPAVKKELM